MHSAQNVPKSTLNRELDERKETEQWNYSRRNKGLSIRGAMLADRVDLREAVPDPVSWAEH
jgi:hypothetical protein